MNFDIVQYGTCFPESKVSKGVKKSSWKRFPLMSGLYLNVVLNEDSNVISGFRVYRNHKILNDFTPSKLKSSQIRVFHTNMSFLFRIKIGNASCKWFVVLDRAEDEQALIDILNQNSIPILQSNMRASNSSSSCEADTSLASIPPSIGSRSTVSARSIPSSALSSRYIEKPDIEKRVQCALKFKEPFNFSVETYCYANVKRSQQDRLIEWMHVAVVSDLMVSAIPSDRNKEPIFLVTRGVKFLESVVPSQSHLRAFTAGNILYLKVRLQDADETIKHIQLIFHNNRDVDMLAEWLFQFGVEVNYPQNIDSDLTRPSSGWGPRSFSSSSLSNVSRSSRFWSRRRKEIDLASAQS